MGLGLPVVEGGDRLLPPVGILSQAAHMTHII
jgi:hypothetical protein